MSTQQVARMGTAAARHDAMVAAYDTQRERFAGTGRDTWAGLAQGFRSDPRRPLDDLLTAIASYVRPDDIVIDVGGGAGRLSLPLALRCREVVVVDPSPAMREAFEGSLKDSGIKNARFVESGWLEADGISGDAALVAHVTYFVPEIVPFIQKLQSAARRRVVAVFRSVPPPNQVADFFRLANGEELAVVPGYQELLPVLEELGIANEVIDAGPAAASSTVSIGQTPEEAVRAEAKALMALGWLQPEETERVERLFGEHFDELFEKTDRGYWRRSALGARTVLVTWETS